MNTEAFANSKIVQFIFRVIGAAMESRFRYRFFGPEQILRGADIHPGQTVLEVGCGTGFFTLSAAQFIGDQGFSGNGCATSVYRSSIKEGTNRQLEECLRCQR